MKTPSLSRGTIASPWSLVNTLQGFFQTKRRRLLSSIPVVLLIGATCIQCSGNPAGSKLLSEANASAHAIILTDSSTTFRDNLPKALADVTNLASVLDPDCTILSLARVDSELREVYSQPVPSDDEGFLLEVVEAVKSESGQDNTYLQKGFGWIVERVNASTGDCLVVVASDWFGEGMTIEDWAHLGHAASELADNPRVLAVYVTGVDPKNRAKLRRWLEPVSPKLRFATVGNLDPREAGEVLKRGGGR